MPPPIIVVVLVLWNLFLANTDCKEVENSKRVVIVLLVRNKEHTLPHFLALLENLDYPKERIALFIRSDNNEDDTSIILRSWIKKIGDIYNYQDVNATIDSVGPYEFANNWDERRHRRIISLKEEGLEYGRSIWADLVWFLDSNVFITNSKTLSDLAAKDNMAIYGPLLQSHSSYINFWSRMSREYGGYYTKDDYIIENYAAIGCFDVFMIRSSVLVNLNVISTRFLTFIPEKIPNYDGPINETITFAISALHQELKTEVCNDMDYGYVMPPNSIDHVSLSNSKLHMLDEMDPKPLPFLPEFEEYIRYSKPEPLGVDRIYMINLDRQEKRRIRMNLCFEELGLDDVEMVPAVDGSTIDEEYMRKNGIKVMEGFVEPHGNRPIKYGEIGCFMSHYHIWQDIIANDYKEAIVFEDDVQFEPNFRQNFENLMRETEDFDYDFIFLGRKMLDSNESFVEGRPSLVHVGFSYWTLAYLITNEGARKLVDAEPLKQMIPLDEYIPIMYDKQRNETLKEKFPNRNLKAFSVNPLFVHPTLYPGHPGHISDTEDSTVFHDEL